MRYPEFLTKNGKIGLVAPSFGCNTEPYNSLLNSAILYFEKRKYQIIKGENIFNYEEVASASSLNRANEFLKMYESDVDIVWSVGGGEMMFDILPYIDFKRLSNLKPKFFIGYSDNTNLTFLLTTICDVATIYGMNFPSFGVRKLHQQNFDILSLLKNEKLSFNSYKSYDIANENIDHLAGLNLKKRVKWKSINNDNKISIEGRIIGGCFDILSLICGSKYDNVKTFLEKYKDDGFIWYFDNYGYDSLMFYRALLQLDYAGWFKYVKGFVFGRNHCTNEPFDFSFIRAIKKVLNKYNVAILYDVDIGHIAPSLPIINGAIANISYENHQGKINYFLK